LGVSESYVKQYGAPSVEFTLHNLVNTNCHKKNTDITENIIFSYIIITIFFQINKRLVVTDTGHGVEWNSKQVIEYSGTVNRSWSTVEQ
jgi:hypothetical protein